MAPSRPQPKRGGRLPLLLGLEARQRRRALYFPRRARNGGGLASEREHANRRLEADRSGGVPIDGDRVSAAPRPGGAFTTDLQEPSPRRGYLGRRPTSVRAERSRRCEESMTAAPDSRATRRVTPQRILNVREPNALDRPWLDRTRPERARHDLTIEVDRRSQVRSPRVQTPAPHCAFTRNPANPSRCTRRRGHGPSRYRLRSDAVVASARRSGHDTRPGLADGERAGAYGQADLLGSAAAHQQSQ